MEQTPVTSSAEPLSSLEVAKEKHRYSILRPLELFRLLRQKILGIRNPIADNLESQKLSDQVKDETQDMSLPHVDADDLRAAAASEFESEVPQQEIVEQAPLTPETFITELAQGGVFRLPYVVNGKQLFCMVKSENNLKNYPDMGDWCDTVFSAIVYEAEAWDSARTASLVAHRDLLLAREENKVGKPFIYSDYRMNRKDPSYLNLDVFQAQEFAAAFSQSNYTVQRKNDEAYKFLLGIGKSMHAMILGVLLHDFHPEYVKTGIDLSDKGAELWNASGLSFSEGDRAKSLPIDYSVMERFIKARLQLVIDAGLERVQRRDGK